MLIFVLDDEAYLLATEARVIEAARPDAEIRCFQRAQDAMDCILNEKLCPDAAFCDIQMPGVSGLEFAVRLREASPSTRVIFVTGYEQYAVEAYRIHAHGYVLKPLDADRVAEELSFWEAASSAAAIPAPAPKGDRLTARCFGQFDAFWNGIPLSFDRRKTKELLAFLIDKVRGEGIPAVFTIEFSNEKMADVICEDTGCRKLLFHSCHNVSARELERGVTYLELMRGNVDALKEALG